jgi:hypothetical protein
MDIGPEKPARVIEPATIPVPARERRTAPATPVPQRAPKRTPATPATPRRDPRKVPAR